MRDAVILAAVVVAIALGGLIRNTGGRIETLRSPALRPALRVALPSLILGAMMCLFVGLSTQYTLGTLVIAIVAGMWLQEWFGPWRNMGIQSPSGERLD